MYVISGATGNTGKPIVQTLLTAGKKVRALGRSEQKLSELKSRGAETLVGELTDARFLSQAFQGATAVYAMIPPNFTAQNFRGYQNSVADAFVQAVEKSGVKYVVTLSSIGAHLPAKAGVVQGLYDMEQRFNQLKGVQILHLRPGYFMENLFGQIGTIKQIGVMGTPLKADLKIPLIATRDIGAYAAKRLQQLDFSGTGNVEYLLGARDVSYGEIAQVFGKAIGNSGLKYVQFPFEEAKKAMMAGWGLSESAADAMNEFVASMNSGQILGDVKRNAQNTTPTTLEEFVPILAQVFQNS